MRRLTNDIIVHHLTSTLRWRLSDDDLALIRLHLLWCLPERRMITENIVAAEDLDAGGDVRPPGEYSAEQASRLRQLVARASSNVALLLRAFVNAVPPAQRRSAYMSALVAAVQPRVARAADVARKTALVNILTRHGLVDQDSSKAFVRAQFAQSVQRALAGTTLKGGTKPVCCVCVCRDFVSF